MYNYQTFRREQLISQQFQQVKKQFKNTQVKRQQSCPSLAHSHKKRVEGFILSAIDKPVPVTQYKNQPPCFRNTAGPTISSKGFYIRKESQSQRIQHSLKNNSQLDQVPFTNSANHKFRQSSCHKGLKYKPMTQNLRIKEFLDKHELNYLPNSNQSRKQAKLIKKAMKGEKVNMTLLKKSLNKTLLPILHAKTYFKSVSTLFTQIPQQNAKIEPVYTSQDVTGEEMEGERRTAKPKDHMSRKQNSRQALMKCNMLKNTLRA